MMATTLTTEDKTAVKGHAIYLEFSNVEGVHNSVTQLLLMPSIKRAGSTDVHTPAVMYRRTLTSRTPRRQWRMVTGASVLSRWESLKHDLAAAGRPTPTSEMYGYLVEKIVDSFQRPIVRMSSSGSGWKIRTAPIVVEVTSEDAEAVAIAKTPYKVIGRVNSVRTSRGLPKNYLQESVSASGI
jgi:hypothetical protein